MMRNHRKEDFTAAARKRGEKQKTATNELLCPLPFSAPPCLGGEFRIPFYKVLPNLPMTKEQVKLRILAVTGRKSWSAQPTF
jgi:hypothetical protein